jgi:predicted TIM-barrel fold metal-dependent hydrolase
MESPDLWAGVMPASFWPDAGRSFQAHPGGNDPRERVKEMAQDGVSAEVLYPTLGLKLFSLEGASVQEAAFRVYNDWLIEYCQEAPDRLVGIAQVATYDIGHALWELERCRNAGLRGAQVWAAPHPDLSFASDYYDRFWAAVQHLEMPVSLHILTGHDYSRNMERHGLELYRCSVNLKLSGIYNALFDIVFSGVLERFPRLKLVLVEYEIGWLPFLFQQWDYYVRRFGAKEPLPIPKPPSEYFARQVYATFFNDAIGCSLLGRWGTGNCMWSNDFPHPNSTWPRSREVIARDLGHLPAEARRKVVATNVMRLYNLTPPGPAAAP